MLVITVKRNAATIRPINIMLFKEYINEQGIFATFHALSYVL
jgi:hypothetical protein